MADMCQHCQVNEAMQDALICEPCFDAELKEFDGSPVVDPMDEDKIQEFLEMEHKEFHYPCGCDDEMCPSCKAFQQV